MFDHIWFISNLYRLFTWGATGLVHEYRYTEQYSLTNIHSVMVANSNSQAIWFLCGSPCHSHFSILIDSTIVNRSLHCLIFLLLHEKMIFNSLFNKCLLRENGLSIQKNVICCSYQHFSYEKYEIWVIHLK